MSDLRRRLGRDGERAAEAHLRRRGYEVIERNFRTREGELDLIGFDGTTIVFCEVKTRRAGSREPWESLGQAKRRQVRTMAAIWLATQTSRPTIRGAALRRDRGRVRRAGAVGGTGPSGGRVLSQRRTGDGALSGDPAASAPRPSSPSCW